MATGIAVVRDMDEGLVIEEGQDDKKKEEERKQHRERQLIENPDILFRVYRQTELHVLLFRPTNDSWWIRTLRDRYPAISAQWTFQHAVDQPIRHVMNLSGDRRRLQRFCDDFPNNRLTSLEDEDLRATVQDLRAAIEDLRVGIQDLKLEKTTCSLQ